MLSGLATKIFRPILLWVLTNTFPGLGSLQMEDVTVPQPLLLGQRASLSCRYNLEGEPLYSVKWYHNGREFYRHMPRLDEWTPVFPVTGISILSHKSSNSLSTVVLRVGLHTGGVFRCEVSSEAPHFDTAVKAVQANVSAIPHGPHISGLSSSYRPGDTVMGTCKTTGALPSPTLIWYINGAPITHGSIERQGGGTVSLSQRVDLEGLEDSFLTITFKLRNDHFKGNRLKLKCVAMVGDFFLKTNEVSLERIGMLKGRDEGIEDTAPKAREKAKSLGSWWMASTPLPSLDNQGVSPTLQPLWFSDPRTESYHGLGVRSSSSRGSKSKRSEFTTTCAMLLCALPFLMQLCYF